LSTSVQQSLVTVNGNLSNMQCAETVRLSVWCWRRLQQEIWANAHETRESL